MESAAHLLAPLALIAAGGEGRRLGADGPKALVGCAGRSLLAWALDAFTGAATFAAPGARIVVAAHASDLPAFERAAEPAREHGAEVLVCAGGASRSHSVRAAFAAAGGPAGCGIVFVHDAARPLAGARLVDALAGGLGDADALVPAAPVADTIKQADADGVVTATLDRATLWAVQTPQAFRPEALAAALGLGAPPRDAVLAAATDDASLVEDAGGVVRILPWREANPKVTTAADLEVVAGLLAG